MSQESQNRPGIVGAVNSPGQSATPEEYPDSDAPPYERNLDPISSILDASQPKKAPPNLPTLMQTPSMTGPAATRPRKGTNEALDPATQLAD